MHIVILQRFDQTRKVYPTPNCALRKVIDRRLTLLSLPTRPCQVSKV